MIEQLKSSIVSFGAEWVLWLLAGVSVLSLAVMFDRWWAFWARRDPISNLASELAALLKHGDLGAARARLLRGTSSEAKVALAGLDRWPHGGTAVRAALAAARGLEQRRLERRLLILGTIGNNAPFIGLLGTVIGVVGAFDELGRAGAQVGLSSTALAPERVMSTISEALVATVAGLLVAIPAVCAFNYFQGRLAARLVDADTLGEVLLAHVPSVGREED
jgi:biopolymer transport protein ExbB